MNKNYTEGLKEFNKKYEVNIKGIAKAQNVDMGVASLMFIHNAHLLMNGKAFPPEWKAGSGAIDVMQYIEDVKALEDLKKNLQK